MLSSRLASLRVTPSGVPRASTIRWRLVPALPRSVGFGPVADPLFSPEQLHCPAKPGSNPIALPLPGVPATRGAEQPKRQMPASRVNGASRSCPSHSPSQRVSIPTAGPYAARTRCRTAPHDLEHAAAHLRAVVGPAAAEVRGQPKVRRSTKVWTCRGSRQLNPEF